MSASVPETDWRVRAPWPDELERAPADIRALASRRGARRHWFWVLVTGELERIVGAATLAERDPAAAGSAPTGRLAFSLAPGWRGSVEPSLALIRAALSQADALGLAMVECQATLGTPAAAWLAENGFERRRIQELWRVPLESNFTRRRSAVERAIARRPVDIHALGEASLPAVRAICGAHGLLPSHRVVLADRRRDGFDPRLSFVAGPAEAPVAVLLARAIAGQPHLEALARAPGSISSAGPEVGALLHAFFGAALNLGATEAVCTLHAGHAPDTARLLARARAHLVERIALFVRGAPPLPAP